MYYNKSSNEVVEALKVVPESGLSDAEVLERRSQYGENKLKEGQKKSLLAMFFSQMKDPLIYVLLAAAAVTIVVKEYTDAVIILAVVLLNAVIGLVQESKAEKAIEALKQLTSPHTIVRRGGKTVEIDSKELVPGDIVILDAGRFVPADIRLTETKTLQIEESSLTGESVPTDKDATFVSDSDKCPLGDRQNMAFMSTLVTYGRGEGVVVGTGMQTEVGKIAESLNEATDQLTPLQKKLEEIGKLLGFMALGITIIMFVLGLVQNRDLFTMFMTAISLAVAAIPEGLPAIVAIVLALGVTRMSKANAIVKKLPAVETLGAVNIICSDKTGTLTQNKMTVMSIYTQGGATSVKSPDAKALTDDEKALIRSMVLCSDATADETGSTGDPTEVALVVLGNQVGLEKASMARQAKRVGEKPFDSDRKMMSTLVAVEGGYEVHTKGAVDQLLKVVTHIQDGGVVRAIEDADKRAILEAAEQYSKEALRVLGASTKRVQTEIAPDAMESELIFLGLVAMIDPPREEVKPAIEKAKAAGVTPVMITGDHVVTAFAIAKELGIATEVSQTISGEELDALSEEALSDKIESLRVFARVSPEHKVKIVKAFKSKGHIVSMTGDGVNDAPSLKHADIGVAMGITGTDVSKGASDMILTDDNFTTIVKAVEEGRTIYKNIKKAVVFLLSCNFGEIVAIFTSVLMNFAIPLLPTQILWVNLVTDSLPALALGVDPGDKRVMSEKPRRPDESFFAGGAGFRAILGGLLVGATTLVAFAIGLQENGYSLMTSQAASESALTYARTMAFVVLASSQLFYAISMRSLEKPLYKVGVFRNKRLFGAVVVGLVLQAIVISVPMLASAFKVMPLPLHDWVIVFALAVIPFIASEVVKTVRYALKKGDVQ